jgi:hypothetical protein
MATTLHLVFSTVPDGVSEDEFNRWYDPHLQEILAVPGFRSAQRYRIEKVGELTEDEARYLYLSLYEIDGEVKDALAALTAAINAGEMTLPDWVPQISFGGWSCFPVGARLESASAETASPAPDS